MSEEKYIEVYTDGSCSPNPGKGGWAFVAISSDENIVYEFVGNGFEKKTTNNRMELTAVIQAVKNLNGHFFKIYSDSLYVINCATGKWGKNSNKDLWEKYQKITAKKVMTFQWVKGHSKNYYNEMVDKLAKEKIF